MGRLKALPTHQTRLGDIKRVRNQKQEAEKPTEQKVAAAKAELETVKLKKQLQLSRTENARLHEKNELLRKNLQQAKDLLAEVTRLTKNSRQDVTPSQPKRSPAKVVPIREVAAAKSDDRPSKQ